MNNDIFKLRDDFFEILYQLFFFKELTCLILVFDTIRHVYVLVILNTFKDGCEKIVNFFLKCKVVKHRLRAKLDV